MKGSVEVWRESLGRDYDLLDAGHVLTPERLATTGVHNEAVRVRLCREKQRRSAAKARQTLERRRSNRPRVFGEDVGASCAADESAIDEAEL